MKITRVIILLAFICQPLELVGQDLDGQVRRIWSDAAALVSTDILLPTGYDSTKAYPLLVALHGFGSSAELFGRIAPDFTDAGFIVALPEGAYSVLIGERVGRDWFIHQPPTEWSELRHRALKVTAQSQIPSVLAAVGSEHKISDVYLLGFSQGGIVAYYSGITNHEYVDGIVIFGSLMLDDWMDSSTLAEANNIPVLIFQGTEDQLVTSQMSESTRDLLLNNGFDVTYREFAGGHTVPPELLPSVVEWIREQSGDDR